MHLAAPLNLDAFPMQNPHFFWLFMLLFTSFCVDPLNGFNATAAKADVGVILDLGTTLGKIRKTCISMAIEDFYSSRNYSTMIEPHFMDSKEDVVTAASAGMLSLLSRIHFLYRAQLDSKL